MRLTDPTAVIERLAGLSETIRGHAGKFAEKRLRLNSEESWLFAMNSLSIGEAVYADC